MQRRNVTPLPSNLLSHGLRVLRGERERENLARYKRLSESKSALDARTKAMRKGSCRATAAAAAAMLAAVLALSHLDSAASQTFHYSHGWTNGKRAAPMDAVKRSATIPQGGGGGVGESMLVRSLAGRSGGGNQEEEEEVRAKLSPCLFEIFAITYCAKHESLCCISSVTAGKSDAAAPAESVPAANVRSGRRRWRRWRR